MKEYIYMLKYVIVLFVLFLGSSMTAQEGETVTIPLSRPGEDGNLRVHLIKGSISVKGYNGTDVKVTAVGKLKSKSNTKYKDGLKKVDGGLSFSVEERDNSVYVNKSPIGNTSVDFEILVPRNFSVDLKTINNGMITVDNVDGTHEASNTNGKITMTNVGGSVVADALNHDIVITFRKIAPETTMMFTSLNGDVDVTFPSDLKANIHAKSDFGNVYTDFDIKVDRNAGKSESTSKNGVYKVKKDKGIYGSINGGGANLTFKTLNGDVLIRSH